MLDMKLDVFADRARRALRAQRKICQDPHPAEDDVFADLLAQATGTAFGNEHGLRAVRTLDEWRRAIPIRSYSGFEPYVQRIAAGETAVLTNDQPNALLRTSGTTGAPKLIPTSRHWRTRYRGPALYAQWGLYFEEVRMERVPADSVLDLSWEPTWLPQSADLPVYGISQRPTVCGQGDWRPPWYGAPWFGPAQVPGTPSANFTDDLYEKLCLLAGCSVRMIVSVNPSKIISLGEVLSERSEQFIEALIDCRRRAVRISAAGPLPGLAARLGRVVEGGRRLRLTDLWPDLELVVCWNSASARLYQSKLGQILPGVRALPFSSTGTEGIVTLPVDDHPSAGPLALNQGLYEFVEWTNLNDGSPLPSDAQTLGFRQLSPGKSYRLVMSQGNGLYRYDVGDVYRVSGWIGRTPRLEFVGRAGYQTSFTGEKLTENQVYIAVIRALEKDEANPTGHPLFTGIPVWGDPPGYIIAIELKKPANDAESRSLALSIEAALQEANVEYRDKRRSGRLRPVSVMPLPLGAFRNVAERSFTQGTPAAQIKHHWIQRDDSLLSVLSELRLSAAIGEPS
jgi:GH3 auxin-responsive promoter